MIIRVQSVTESMMPAFTNPSMMTSLEICETASMSHLACSGLRTDMRRVGTYLAPVWSQFIISSDGGYCDL